MSEVRPGNVRVDRKLRLTVGSGDVFYRLGFQNGTYFAPFLRSEQKSSDGQYIDESPSVSVWIPRDARTIELPQASYTNVSSLVEVLQDYTNPLWFDPSLTAAERTILFVQPSGSVSSVTIDGGWYEPNLFADNITARLNSLSETANMTVTYNSLTGRFTFANIIGTPFGIDFRESTIMARHLGFETDSYVGLSTYSSS